MTLNHTPLRRLLVLLVLLGLVVAACGNSGDDDEGAAGDEPVTDTSADKVSVSGVPGVTDDEIRYAVLGTKANNPLGTCILDCYVQGVKAYFAYRNSEGGVHGRDLVVTKVLDDELSKNQLRALEIVEAKDTFGAFSAPLIATGYADIAKAGMPLYVWAIHSKEMTGQQSIFGHVFGVNCADCTLRSGSYVMKLAGAKKAAVLGMGVSEASKKCAGATARSVELYGDQLGQSVGYFNDDLPFGLPNGIGPEVTAMKRAGVDFILTCLDLNSMKTIAQELQRQGMADVHMLHPNTYDLEFVKAAGDLFEGDYLQTATRPFEAEAGDSALAQYHQWMKKTGAKETEISMAGWINATLAYEGLKAAGPDFDQARVIAATNTMTSFSAAGLINPIDWTRQHEPPSQADLATHGPEQECFSFVQVKSGKFLMVGERDKPFLCWPGDTRDWSEPTPTDVK